MMRNQFVIGALVSFSLIVSGAFVQEIKKETNRLQDDTFKNNQRVPNENELTNTTKTNSKEQPENHLNGAIPLELKCNLDKKVVKEISGYKNVVHQIIEFVVNGPFKGKTFDKLAQLTDTFGSRMTGSKSLEDSIDWMQKQFQEQKFDNVHTEPVEAPHWIRNNESLFLIEPRLEKLDMLGLGSSVATPLGGIIAEGIVVDSFHHLEQIKDQVKHKIVIFNPSWEGYGTTVAYRANAASKAAKYGAVATLVRSITPFSINSPHTGWQSYEDSVNKIPTACITMEDALMLHRLQQRGEKLVLKLDMGAENLPNVITRNSIADLKGSEKPEEIVIVSGHLDSWDVGVGAMDDGGGVMISWSAPTIMKLMGLRPRRTVRTVLFTAEEQGLYGGQEYFNKHSHAAENYQLILESDIGTFNPLGLSFSGNTASQCIIKEIIQLLQPINATQLTTPVRGGPDIGFWEKSGVPLGSVLNDDEEYFWFHHSHGDRMEVEDSPTLDRCAALWTAISYVTADISFRLPRD